MSHSPSDEAAMATVMGFSSFGDQTRPNKKRRYNPHADNVTGLPGPSTSSTGDVNPTPSDVSGTESSAAAPGSSLPMHLPPKPTPAADSSAPDLGHGFQAHHRGGQGGYGRSGRGGRGNRHGGRGRGEDDEDSRAPRNDKWYVDYYDPMSNENPWTELEKQMGLPSRGTWLERGYRLT